MGLAISACKCILRFMLVSTSITIVKRRAIGPYLIGFYVTLETVFYEKRLQFHLTALRLTPGSTMWQMYKHA